jgi:glycosyltransferase involved in cell wall biosynthesis
MDDIAKNTTSRQIKVCLVSLDAYLLFNPKAVGVQGGTEVDFFMIASELAKDKRFRVSIITGDFGQQVVEAFGEITVYKAANSGRNLFSSAAALWKAMRIANADIYFRQGAAITTDLVALFCRLNHKSFFLRTAHDIECNGRYLKQYPLRGKFYLWALQQAKCVFVQKASDSSALLKTTGIHSVVIPNGHHIANLTENERDFILWVARSEDFKQPRIFIELARKIPSEQFVMICQRTKGDNHYDELVGLAESISNLKFIKYVPFHDIDFYFKRAKIFVNTSTAEGFPSTFIQAGNCATPVLSLNVNPDKFLDKLNCGICCNGSETAMVEALKSLSLQPSRFIDMGKNLRKYVEDHNDIAKIIETYKKFFIDAVSENPVYQENKK